MAITLGSEALSDAEVTDRIGRGDVDAAAGLWVRYWSTALVAARQYVVPDEVPGLAAEALIGTIAAIAVGGGPREDLSSFVTDAVDELGENDVPPTAEAAPVPDVFVSPLMTRAFADLSGEDQEILWLTNAAGESDRLTAETLDLPLPMAAEARVGALTALQRDYLAEHTEQADGTACHQAHGAMAAVVTRGVPLTGATWVHMSECAWCTEAFHELAFSNVAIDALVDRGAVAPAPGAPVPVPVPVAVPAETVVAAAAAEDPVEPVLEEAPTEPDPAQSGSRAAFSPVSMLRGRRTRIAGGALLVAAAITAAVLVVTGPDDSDGTLTTAGTERTQDEPARLPGVFDSVVPPVVDEPQKPTQTPIPTPPSTPRPVSTPTAQLTPGEQPSSTPRPTPATSAEPTAKPTPEPTATPEPTPTPVTPTPTPTPAGPPCNDLAHFFGFC